LGTFFGVSKLRFVHDVFPHKGYMWNYGALPQTWEDPTHKHPDTDCFGDNDPLDACEIGSAVGVRGEIKQVKALGIMALIDEGETDWKVIVIDVNDPMADKLNDISDVQKLLPGFTMATYEWFRTYKMPAGKPANEFAFNGEAKGREYAHNIITENYNFWKRINSGEIPQKSDKYDVNAFNTSCENSPHKKDELSVDIKPYVAGEDVKPFEEVSTTNVKEIVEQQQRKSPHGTSELSNIIFNIAVGTQKAAKEGPGALVGTLKDLNLAGVYRAGEDNALLSNENGHYSVYFNAADQVLVFGIYQKSTPHTIEFSLSSDVSKEGLELVAAGYAKDGKFTFTTRHGAVTVSDGKVFDQVDDAPSVNSDSLLGVKAPLAFFN